MLKSVAVISTALLTSGASLIGVDQRGQDPITVAAWNIAHLAGEPGQGCVPRDAAGYQIVADTIDAVGADVWLLQEIENEAALARVFDPEEWTFHVEARADTGPGPECRGRDDGSRLQMQRTAIVVRNDIEHSRGPDLAALDVDGRGRLRHGVTVTIEVDGDVLDLLSVHLKSGCFFGDTRDACTTLFRQVPVLEAWIDERSEAGRAVLVGGDFNRRLEGAGDAVWRDLADGDPAALGIAGEGIGPECDPRYRQFIDFLVMNEDASASVDPGSFNETTYGDGARPSDHCPISVVIGR